MDADNETLEQFLNIVGVDQLSLQEAKKFVKWGKNNIQHSLNYYYNKREKKSYNFVESSNNLKENNAFLKMQEGQRKQQQLQQMQNQIRQARQTMQTSIPQIPDQPITEEDRKQEKKYDFQSLFEQADYLPRVFNENDTDKISEVQQNNKILQENNRLFQQNNSDQNIDSTEENMSGFGDFLKSTKDKPQSSSGFGDFCKQTKDSAQKAEKMEEELNQIIEKKPLLYMPKQKNPSESGSKPQSIQKQEAPQSTIQTLQQIQPSEQLQTEQYLKNLKISNDELVYVGNVHKLNDKQKEGLIGCISDARGKKYEGALQVGTCLVECSSTVKMKAEIYSHEKVYFTMQKPKLIDNENYKKKRNACTNKNIMRLVYKDIELGRVDQIFADIFYHLLEKDCITLEGHIVQAPRIIDYFCGIRVEVTIYILPKAITKPVITIISNEGQTPEEEATLAFCRQFKDDFQKILNYCEVEMLQSTLIPMPKHKSQIAQRMDKLEPEKAVKEAKQQNNRVNIFDPFQKPLQQKSIKDFNLKKEDKPNEPENNDQKTQQQDAKGKKKGKKKGDKEDINEDGVEDEEFDKIALEKLIMADQMENLKIRLYKPPSTFQSNLHPYQQQALTWMLYREGKLDVYKNLMMENTRQLHPQWQEYRLMDGNRVYFNPYTGQLSTIFPRAKAQETLGGICDHDILYSEIINNFYYQYYYNVHILADEMGLGKTVMMIALIHSNKKWGTQVESNFEGDEEGKHPDLKATNDENQIEQNSDTQSII